MGSPSQACRFPTAARPLSAPPGARSSEGDVGPGKYDASAATHVGGPTMHSKSRRSDATGGKDASTEPGPGAYTFDGSLGGCSATFGRACRAVSSSHDPGGTHQSALENAVAAVAAENQHSRGSKMESGGSVGEDIRREGRGIKFPRAKRKPPE